MSLEIGTAIDALLFWEYELKGKKGPIVFDIGVYKHNPHKAPPGSTDIVAFGKEITLPNFIEFLEQVKEKADVMTQYGTYWYEGIKEPSTRDQKRYDQKVDFKIFWERRFSIASIAVYSKQ